MTQPMAVFFDIDGTLLPDWRETIPAETMDAVRAAQANGHICILNTGRAYGTVDTHLREAGFDGIISGVGTRATFRGELIWQHEISEAGVRRVIEAGRASGVRIVYEGNDFTAYDTFCLPLTEAEQKLLDSYRAAGRRIAEFGEHDCLPLAKFIVSPVRGGDQAKFYSMIDGYAVIDYGNGWAEVVPEGYDKGSAMLRMLDHLGMTPEQAIAVGDSQNDIPMLRLTPKSVAMGNGKAKEFPVSFVTLPCREGGIPHMLRHFGLID